MLEDVHLLSLSKDGQLKGVKIGSRTISLTNGPRFIAAKRSDRSMDQFYNHDDKEAEKEENPIYNI